MRLQVVVCVVFAGCGFRSPAGDGTSDGGGGPGTGADSTGCLPQWMNHTVRIDTSTVQEITELSSLGSDRNPWVSDDGLRIYFSRDVGAPSQSDIYFASRVSRTAAFTVPLLVANLNSNSREGRPSLTSDEATLALSTDRDGQFDIHMTQKSNGVLGVAEATHLAQVNAVGTSRFDPFLSADGLHLYLAANTGTSGRLQLLVATRSSATEDFAAPTLVPGIDNTINQADPMLSRDEILLVYSAYPNNDPGDLWYATRSSATANFGTPVRVPGVDTNASEFDPMLSPDGCELYFASTRNGGRFHLFHAQVTK